MTIKIEIVLLRKKVKIMVRAIIILTLVVFVCNAVQRFPKLSDPLALGGLGWEIGELQVEDYVEGSVWPKPQGETRNGAVYSLSSETFKFSITAQSSDVLEDAIKRYKQLTFPEDFSEIKKNLPQITQLTIQVIDKYENLTLDSDESCKCEGYNFKNADKIHYYFH